MPNVFRLVGISGSLRKESWNTKLLKAFGTVSAEEEFVSKNVQFEIADWSKYYQFTTSLIKEYLFTMEI